MTAVMQLLMETRNHKGSSFKHFMGIFIAARFCHRRRVDRREQAPPRTVVASNNGFIAILMALTIGSPAELVCQWEYDSFCSV
jgi:hypothetical protein